MQALLPKAATGVHFARLLWLIEELLYEDLLKGSGWGRRRSWFRDQLEATRNIAQVCRLFLRYHHVTVMTATKSYNHEMVVVTISESSIQ